MRAGNVRASAAAPPPVAVRGAGVGPVARTHPLGWVLGTQVRDPVTARKCERILARTHRQVQMARTHPLGWVRGAQVRDP